MAWNEEATATIPSQQDDEWPELPGGARYSEGQSADLGDDAGWNYPGDDPMVPVEDLHPDVSQQERVLMRFASADRPQVLAHSFQKKGFEVGQSFDGRLTLRKPGGKWYALDPAKAGIGEAMMDLAEVFYTHGPSLGAMGIGGAAGSAIGGPLGGIAGAGTATAAQQATIGRAWAPIAGVEYPPGQELSAIGSSFIEGAVGEAGGQILGKVFRYVGGKLVPKAARERAKAWVNTKAEKWGRKPPFEMPKPREPIWGKIYEGQPPPDYQAASRPLSQQAGGMQPPPHAPIKIPQMSPGLKALEERAVRAESAIERVERFRKQALSEAQAAQSQVGMLTEKLATTEKALEETTQQAAKLKAMPRGARGAGLGKEPADPTVIYSIPEEQIGVDVPRFQIKTGVTAEGVQTPIEGAWDPQAAGVMVLWRDRAGKLWVVNGHHRLSAARARGVKELNAWVLEESQGITEQAAKQRGGLLNILEGQGKPEDWYRFFSNSRDLTAERAKDLGLMRTKVARDAFDLGKGAGPSLDAAYLNEQVDLASAAAIARAFPGEDGLHQTALRIAREQGLKPDEVGPMMALLKDRASRIAGAEGPVQGEMFGMIAPDPRIERFEAEMAKEAMAEMRYLRGKRSLGKAALSRERARQELGLDLESEELAKAGIKGSEEELLAVQRWITNPEIRARIEERVAKRLGYTLDEAKATARPRAKPPEETEWSLKPPEAKAPPPEEIITPKARPTKPIVEEPPVPPEPLPKAPPPETPRQRVLREAGEGPRPTPVKQLSEMSPAKVNQIEQAQELRLKKPKKGTSVWKGESEDIRENLSELLDKRFPTVRYKFEGAEGFSDARKIRVEWVSQRGKLETAEGFIHAKEPWKAALPTPFKKLAEFSKQFRKRSTDRLVAKARAQGWDPSEQVLKDKASLRQQALKYLAEQQPGWHKQVGEKASTRELGEIKLWEEKVTRPESKRFGKSAYTNIDPETIVRVIDPKTGRTWILATPEGGVLQTTASGKTIRLPLRAQKGTVLPSKETAPTQITHEAAEARKEALESLQGPSAKTPPKGLEPQGPGLTPEPQPLNREEAKFWGVTGPTPGPSPWHRIPVWEGGTFRRWEGDRWIDLRKLHEKLQKVKGSQKAKAMGKPKTKGEKKAEMATAEGLGRQSGTIHSGGIPGGGGPAGGAGRRRPPPYEESELGWIGRLGRALRGRQGASEASGGPGLAEGARRNLRAFEAYPGGGSGYAGVRPWIGLSSGRMRVGARAALGGVGAWASGASPGLGVAGAVLAPPALRALGRVTAPVRGRLGGALMRDNGEMLGKLFYVMPLVLRPRAAALLQRAGEPAAYRAGVWAWLQVPAVRRWLGEVEGGGDEER